MDAGKQDKLSGVQLDVVPQHYLEICFPRVQQFLLDARVEERVVEILQEVAVQQVLQDTL